MGRGLRHAAAVLAMICLTTGFTGLSGLIWTGAQQQRVYDDLIRQTKRESVLLSRTKNGGENGSVQRTRVSVEELQERRLEQANAGNKAAGSATGGQKHRGRLENQQTAKQAQMKQTVIDFDVLKKINPDVVSWITIPGTNIDYPLLQGKDNNQYLHKDMEGRDSAAGAIFLDHGDKADLSSRHNIIYGHHMKNGTMFKDIVKYKDQQYFDEHQDIILYTPDREIHLKALAAVVTNPDAIRRKIDFQSQEEFTSYIEEMTKGARAFAAVPKGTAIRRLYSFVTCSYEFQNARTILYAYEEN
ncbi:MAG: class B sortase [Lachnospiraceae bacterium]